MKIALIGAPNAGKTTLFNWLTGFGHKGARPINYPGSTVEVISAPFLLTSVGNSQSSSQSPQNRRGLQTSTTAGSSQSSPCSPQSGGREDSQSEALQPEDRGATGRSWQVFDTPGVYSLQAPTDESRFLLNNLHDFQALVVVIDATQLARQLYLIDEVCEHLYLNCATAPSAPLGTPIQSHTLAAEEPKAKSSLAAEEPKAKSSLAAEEPKAKLSLATPRADTSDELTLNPSRGNLRPPLAVALSMQDLSKEQGLQIDTQALQQHYGVPFVPVDGKLGGGVPELINHLFDAAHQKSSTQIHKEQKITAAVDTVHQKKQSQNFRSGLESLTNSKPWSIEKQQRVREQNFQLAANCISPLRPASPHADSSHADSSHADLSRAASSHGVSSHADLSLAASSHADLSLAASSHADSSHPDSSHAASTFSEQRRQQKNAAQGSARPDPIYSLSDKIDAYLLHPFWGLLGFIALMLGLFIAVFWVAAPFMDATDQFFGWLAQNSFSLLGSGLLASFLAEGVIAGFGAVLVFVPQIFILFLALRLLEASGYLARAALIIDKPLTHLGLSGRSFVPLLSGFACAVPAVMAARQIQSRRERWLAVFIIPLMSCSARLPVYALLLSFLFVGQSAWKPGVALMMIYLTSAFVGGVAAYLLNKIIKPEKQAFFSLDLPLYRRPQIKEALQVAWLRVLSYIKKAGPVIFVLSVLIWGLMTYPNYNEPDEGQRLATSYAGQIGTLMEPVFEPMGLDWRVGAGLIAAFAAREVFVAALAVVLGLSSDAQPDTLLQKMQSARASTGEPLFNWANTLALIVFFMIALQCVSTTGIVAREMGSMSMAITQFVSWNGVAYLLACLIYQVLHTI